MGNEAHIRIDEGVKRGPKKQYRHTPRKRVNEAGLLESIPPDLNPDHVLELYLSRARTSQIAQELGVRRSTLTAWMRDQRPEGWKKVQVIRALLKKESGDEGIEDANDALSLARAREQLRSGQWDLERLDSSNYGQKQEVAVTHDHKVTIEHTLTGSARELFQSIRGISPSNQPVIDIKPEDSSQ